MTPRRKTTKRKRKHVTAHRRALADPIVAKLIAGLRKRWKAMDGIERGDRLRELAALGCSTRGLGKKLRQSATTIRRHMELATLPTKDRDAVKAGASAKKILADKAILDRQRRRKRRITDDRKTGVLSDEVADIILEFCRGGEYPLRAPILEAEFATFINSVALLLFEFEARGQRGIKATKRMGIVGLFEQTQPPVFEETFWMESQAEWLANIVLAKGPECPIRTTALDKAVRRAVELKVKARDERTPLEAFHDQAIRKDIRYAELYASLRPGYYPGGVHSMRKQGSKPVS
jgi:hypothetical protein